MTDALSRSESFSPVPETQLTSTFLTRAAIALFVAALAVLIFERPPGSIVALAFGAPLATLTWLQRHIGWRQEQVSNFALAAFAVLAIFIEPSLVNMLTGFAFVSAAALSTRGYGAEDRLQITRRILLDLFKTPFWIIADTLKVLPQMLGLRPSGLLVTLVVPMIATGIFAGMLLIANPLFESLLVSTLSTSLAGLLSWRLFVVFPLALILGWSVLREGPAKPPPAQGPVDRCWHEMFFKPASVALTLLLLNGFFAVENVLDLKHVWFDSALPPGFTHAQYVHRGSYTLIATVILAAGFIMLALRPGSTSDQSPLVRWLVYLFAAQNFLLVASSAKRTLSYIDDFGMTEWRLAGLIWMGLVGLGLSLTIWRIVGQRSNHWLINSNLNATSILMLVLAFADLRPFIADWNVKRAGSSGAIDLAYAETLGITVLPVLQAYGHSANSTQPWGLSRQIETDAACQRIRHNTWVTQSHWQSWTLRYALLPQLRARPEDGCNFAGAEK